MILKKPDFKFKQIAMVYSERGVRCQLKIRNGNIAFLKDQKVVNQIPTDRANLILVVGDISISSYLIKHAKKNGVTMSLLDYNLRPISSLSSGAEGNYILRSQQYKMSESHQLIIAKGLIEIKLSNQEKLASYVSGNNLSLFDRKLLGSIVEVKSLLGIEGSAARSYFGVIFSNLDNFHRIPRAKLDKTNLLLDVGYSMLFNFVEALANSYGFDLYKGVYHQTFFERKSLVCDLVEPFRPIIDKELVKMIDFDKIFDDDFIKRHDGSFGLKWQSAKKYQMIFMKAILDRKMEMFDLIRSVYYLHFDQTKELFIFDLDKKRAQQ